MLTFEIAITSSASSSRPTSSAVADFFIVARLVSNVFSVVPSIFRSRPDEQATNAIAIIVQRMNLIKRAPFLAINASLRMREIQPTSINAFATLAKHKHWRALQPINSCNCAWIVVFLLTGTLNEHVNFRDLNCDCLVRCPAGQHPTGITRPCSCKSVSRSWLCMAGLQ